MGPWLEATGAVVLAGAGVALGLACSRLRRPWWTLGYFVPLGVVVGVRLTTHLPSLVSTAPFSWLAGGAARYAAMSLAVPMMFVTLLVKLDCARKKVLVAVLAGLVVACHGIVPLAAPAIARSRLEGLGTVVNDAGVCLQQTNFTCGPAAAVTALRALGIEADEGELAVLARTGPTNGTQPGDLVRALRGRFSGDGLTCEYRSFESAAELRDNCPCLAIVKIVALVDHWVAVLEADGERVVVGDPTTGLKRMPLADFEAGWRFRGIVLRRMGGPAGRPEGPDEGGAP